MSKSRSCNRRIGLAFAALALLLSATGCGADFDSQDVVKTLRVLAVQKDQPYAPPTTDPANPSVVNLSMLSYDPRLEPGADPGSTERLWFSGCDDLPGDVYFTCLVRMYYLWQAYTAVPRNSLGEGESWSPVDDLAGMDPSQQADAAFSVTQQINPGIPQELAVSYLSTYRIGSGYTFQYSIPPLIIENHQRSPDLSIPPFGLSLIFFTACTGHIELAPEWHNVDFGAQLRNATLGFPFICVEGKGQPGVDTGGTQLGPDDFVAGYTQQFVYGDGSVNNNPVFENGEVTAATAFSFNDEYVKPTAYCIDSACNPPTVPLAGVCSEDRDLPVDSRKFPHVDACSGKCTAHALLPNLARDRNDDNVNFGQAEPAKGEQMWIDYYADKGSLKHPVRLLRDALEGWSDDNRRDNTWTAPGKPGPANIWAVVHDVRGGVSWAKLLVCVD